MTTKTITVDGVEYVQKDTESQVKIVVLNRGWNVIGYWHRDGDDVTITNASVIRYWGTTKGIGELAQGPTAKTKLDPAGTVRADMRAVVFAIDADADGWVASL